jgi:hypothetical protein
MCIEWIMTFCLIFKYLSKLNTGVRAGAKWHYGYGSTKIMHLRLQALQKYASPGSGSATVMKHSPSSPKHKLMYGGCGEVNTDCRYLLYICLYGIETLNGF